MAYTTINKSTDYFNTVLYEGNGATGRGITGVDHQPDLVWIKNRDATTPHVLTDAVRGATVTLNSNDTSADDTISNGLTAFGTDGFTIGGNGSFNYSNESFVSWNWKANGTGSANTDGSISSTVSVNTTSGFSVVSWSGTGSNGTIGHGLGATPGLMIIKNRNNVGEWRVWNSTFTADQYLYLNRTDAVATQSALFNSTLPTSSVISAGTSGDINSSGRTYIAYCFAEKKGFSKFGKYTGNNNTDGTFVYTGFKPAWIMIKNTTGDNWVMFDNKREGYNPDNDFLQPNSSNAEATESGAKIDLLSNGFKLRGSGGGIGQTNNANLFFYMAFAENPFVSSTGTPVTAR